MAIRRANGRWVVALLPSGDWHPEEIKAAVRMSGSDYEQLANASGLPRGVVRVAAKRPHFEGERVIAAFLGVRPSEIWPSRFRADGSRIPNVRNRSKSTPGAAACLRQNDRVA